MENNLCVTNGSLYKFSKFGGKVAKMFGGYEGCWSRFESYVKYLIAGQLNVPVVGMPEKFPVSEERCCEFLDSIEYCLSNKEEGLLVTDMDKQYKLLSKICDDDGFYGTLGWSMLKGFWYRDIPDFILHPESINYKSLDSNAQHAVIAFIFNVLVLLRKERLKSYSNGKRVNVVVYSEPSEGFMVADILVKRRGLGGLVCSYSFDSYIDLHDALPSLIEILYNNRFADRCLDSSCIAALYLYVKDCFDKHCSGIEVNESKDFKY